MDGKIKKLDGAENCIWLSYTTQFVTGGRTHTVEISVPMPVGASDEVREQLLSEAEAGMGQLISHVEQRIPQILQRTQARPQAAPPTAMPSARPANKQATMPASQASVPQTPNADQEPSSFIAALPEPNEEEDQPPRRAGIGASMPRSSLPASTSTGNLSIPDFISYIREHLDLTPSQAMQMLNVKSLANINLREAADQLRRLLLQKNGDAPALEKREEEDAPPPLRPLTPPVPISLAAKASSEKTAKAATPNQKAAGRVREVSTPVFDEEVEPDEEEADALLDLEDPYELTAQDREMASALVSRLRERRGSTNASEARLRVLDNVIGGDVSTAQMEELVKGLWKANSLKQLKVDQVEELISWGKTDNFISEVEAVLALLEEEYYARGNR